MESAPTHLRWGAEQRLEFVEFRLFWDGKINRSDLIEQFGVSTPQASNDLTQYRNIAPGNIIYDASAKCYFATAAFQPLFLKPNPDRYLAQLKAISEQVMAVADTWLMAPPSADTMPIPTRKVDSVVLRAFVQAIRQSKSIDVLYHSMNHERPDAIWRKIEPHAFAFDGLRWHVRAFCHVSNEFKDFLLSRCRSVGAVEQAEKDPADDRKWFTYFNVVLKPNPSLGQSQQRTVEWDYAMEGGQVTVPVRLAFLYYFDKRLRLDIPSDRPKERPVVVANEEDFRQALRSVAT